MSMGQELWSAVDRYFDGQLLHADPALESALAGSVAAGLPAIQVSPAQGQLLQLLALACGARRVLEIGTLGGYSGIWLARALPPDGTLVTLELEPHHAQVARASFERAGVAGRVEIMVGPALASLARLRAQPAVPFDLVFIDADKEHNLEYVQEALALSRPGTLLLVDNVVRRGAIIGSADDPAAEGIRRMTAWIGQQPRLRAGVVQTVGTKGHDGFLLARVDAPS
jgi:predicted O-methyltransferase YrrM